MRNVAIATIVAGSVIVAGCGGGDSSNPSTKTTAAKAGSPYTVFAEMDTSGPSSVYGLQDKISLQGVVDYLNKSGGILGHPIKVTFANDNGDGATAVTVLQKYLSSHPKPDLLYLGTTASDTSVLVPAVKRLKALTMGAYDGTSLCLKDSQTACPTYFTIRPPSGTEGIAAAQYFKAQGYKKVGIIEEGDAYSEAETPGVVAELKKVGIEVVQAGYTPTAVNVQPQLAKLQKAGVQAVWSEALGASSGYVAKARAALDLIDTLPLVFDPGGASVDLTKLAPIAQLKNAKEMIQRPVDGALSLPGRDLMLQYSKPYGVLDQPLVAAAFSWDNMLVLRNAAVQANSIDGDAIVKALNALSSKASNDPNYIVFPKVLFTPANHENSAVDLTAYDIVEVGPLVNGMVQGQH
jgi:ABC-type branched-subunit amino acid transport system substrate-binding protein